LIEGSDCVVLVLNMCGEHGAHLWKGDIAVMSFSSSGADVKFLEEKLP